MSPPYVETAILPSEKKSSAVVRSQEFQGLESGSVTCPRRSRFALSRGSPWFLKRLALNVSTPGQRRKIYASLRRGYGFREFSDLICITICFPTTRVIDSLRGSEDFGMESTTLFFKSMLSRRFSVSPESRHILRSDVADGFSINRTAISSFLGPA